MPDLAPVIMWVNRPSMGGPAENQNLFPAIASIAERIWLSRAPAVTRARRSSPSDHPTGSRSSGPVISRVPSDAEALPLWQAVTTLTAYPGFVEMKRSLREVPQLTILGGRAATSTDSVQWALWLARSCRTGPRRCSAAVSAVGARSLAPTALS